MCLEVGVTFVRRLPLRKVNFFCHKGIGFDGITFGFASVLNSQVLAFLERLYVLKTYYMSSLESDAVLVVHAPKGFFATK